MTSRTLLAASLLCVGCGASGPFHPTSSSKLPRRYREILVSGPALPSIVNLPSELSRGTGLPARYIGQSGGNLRFEIGAWAVSEGHCAETRVSTDEAGITFSVTSIPNLGIVDQCHLALHEAGHGVGLAHPPQPCSTEVMCGEGNRKVDGSWGPGDLAALAELYQR